MTSCRWNQDAGDYLTDDGKSCKRDDYGDPTRHCTAKRRCSHHVGWNELSCGRCIADVRNDIRAIRDLSALLPVAAMSDGVNSEAANLSGPAADYRVFSARRALDRAWLMAHIPDQNLERAMAALLPDDDEWHPYGVLTRWQMMLSQDYGHDVPEKLTISDAAAYLDRHLHKVAQDDEQDFPLLRREVRTCRQHLETVLHNSSRKERGAPCPLCSTGEPKVFVRLQLEHGHWCIDPDCERIHYADSSGDRWVCPKNREHAWTEAAYRAYVEERSA